MDYEKAYKEALERARKLWSETKANEYTSDTEDYETIFPELAESEDEKIRKEIIKHFQEVLDEHTSVTTSTKVVEWIAWLEKREDDEGDFTIYHPLKNGKGEYECIPYSFFGSLTSFSEDKDLIDFLRTCFYTKEECNEWIEQQKEQKPAEYIPDSIKFDEGFKTGRAVGFREGVESVKPAEWSKEDERHLRLVTALLQSSKEKCLAGFYRDVDESIAWLQSLRPQPKEEWSKGDKLFLQDVADVLGDNEYKDAAKRLRDLSESLYLQPKQEWSEEDEKMLKWIEDILLIADDDLSDRLNGKVSPITDSAYSSMKLCITKCLSWLKSLQNRGNSPKSNTNSPNEWNEEDKTMINHIIEALPKWANGLITILPSQAEEYVKRLKSLRPQSRQEWSEEDVKRLYSIGTQIGFLKGKYSEYQKDIDWLHTFAEKMGFHKCKTGEVVTEWKKEDIDDKMLSKPQQERRTRNDES